MSKEVKKGKRKNGYKHTKIGQLPVEWNVRNLGDISSKIGSGITPTGGESVYQRVGRPFIRSQNVGWGRLLLNEIAYIDEKTHKSFSSTEIKENDILLNITGASIGRCAIADKRIAKGNVNQHVCIIRVNSEVVPPFLAYFILSKKGQNLIDSFQAGGNRQGLNFEHIRSFLIPVPSVSEQQKIVHILNTWDKAINKTEQLIAKKQQFKKGLIQQLLIGKVRFREFVKSKKMKETKLGMIPADWDYYKLGDLVIVKDGTHVTPTYLDSGVPFLRVTDIVNNQENENKRYISKEEHKLLTKVNKPGKGDILYSKNGTIGVAKLIDWDWEFSIFVSLALLRIKDKEIVNDKYLEIWLNSDLAKQEIYRGVKQGTVTNLHLEEIGQFRIVLPHKSEQFKIAKVLIGLNRELNWANEKLKKLKTQKKGLMQKLLTGQVRVNHK